MTAGKAGFKIESLWWVCLAIADLPMDLPLDVMKPW